MLSGLIGGGGADLTKLVGGLLSGRAQAATGDRQGKFSSIGNLVGRGLGACFGGPVGACIGSGIGGLIGGFFDKQAKNKHVAQDKLLVVGHNVVNDERMRLHASNNDIARLIDHMKLYREQELLAAGVRGPDIDELYRNLLDHDRALDDFANIVCSVALSCQGAAKGSGGATGFDGSSAARPEEPPIRFGGELSRTL